LVEGKSNIQSALVFASTKTEVRDIEKKLIKDKASARAIHSDLDQHAREDVLRDFKNRKFQILVATDIISRGIDIEDIDLVVNYDVPRDPEDYVHRIGRTARAQSDGVALTFINKKQRRSFDKIEHFLGTKIYKIPLPADL
jgi:ATP-dependent RNA helicase RhlE